MCTDLNDLMCHGLAQADVILKPQGLKPQQLVRKATTYSE